MVQRTITNIETTWWKDHEGYLVQVTTTYCESTIGGGSMKKDVERYEQLSIEEARDVLDVVAQGDAPGEEFVVQHSMFILQ